MIELVLKTMLNSSLQEMESILRPKILPLSLLVRGKQEQFATETMVILLTQGKKLETSHLRSRVAILFKLRLIWKKASSGGTSMEKNMLFTSATKFWRTPPTGSLSSRPIKLVALFSLSQFMFEVISVKAFILLNYY